MTMIAVQKSAWDALTPGQRETVLHTAEHGVEVELGQPVDAYSDESGVQWLVWDDAGLSENVVALVAAQMANPPLIVETTWEVDDAE